MLRFGRIISYLPTQNEVYNDYSLIACYSGLQRRTMTIHQFANVDSIGT